MLPPPLSHGLPSSLDTLERLDAVDAPTTHTIGDAPVPVPPADIPHGLPNSDGATCYVNASLQVILNSADLRQQVLQVHPHGGFDALFRSIDSPAASADAVKEHRDAVIAYLRGAPIETTTNATSTPLIPMEGAAQSAEAMNVLLDAPRFEDSPIAGLYLDDAEYAKDPDGTIGEGYAIAVASKYIAGKRVFAAPALFGVQAVFDMAELIGSPLTGFTYHEKGHYVAYIAKGEHWYRIDDSIITPCAGEDVVKLALAVPEASTLDAPNPAVPLGEGYGVEVFAFA